MTDREAYDEQQDKEYHQTRAALAESRFEEVQIIPLHSDGEVPEADLLDEMIQTYEEERSHGEEESSDVKDQPSN